MMSVVEAVFAALGVIFLLLLAIAVAGGAFRHTPSASTPAGISPANDPALPYREALYTAIRIQQAAQEAEHELFAKARLHREIDGNQRHDRP